MAEQGGTLKEMKLGFIGAGSMGGAIIRGLAAAGLPRENLVYYDPDPARQAEMKALGVDLALNYGAVMERPVVVLAVKPQVMPAVLEELEPKARSWHLIISVAAGVTLATLEAAFPESRVIRAMPNAPATAGAGMTAISLGSRAAPEDEALALALFDAVGLAVALDEKLMDAVTGLSGSGPAFAAVFIEALADGGVKVGLPRALALTLAAQTVLGAARLCLEGGLSPGALKDQVASPGGTTIEGLHVLEQAGFRGAVISAVEAAAWRSRELGGK
jgi:pyrroline-5-carboxylate reductase